MSLVLVSPSQEIALKVVSILSLRIFFKIDDDKFASVKTNPSVVAMFGNIIPEPLAIPYTFIDVLPILHSDIANLGFMSVVLIPDAAFIHINLF